MATTSQVTSYRAAGQPDDAVGAVGDICWDTTNRITWVKQANNSWVNGAYSNIGPTGPAQLSGSGAPTGGLGIIGNGYTDQASGLTYLKGSNGWAQVGSIIGPQGLIGPAGFTSMAAATAAPGPLLANPSASVSTTPLVLNIPGTSVPQTFTPVVSSALMGVGGTNNGTAVTAELYDQTASKSVYSFSLGANLNVAASLFTSTQYPMVAGNAHVWRITASGSGTSNVLITPHYLVPSAAAVPAACPVGPWLTPASTAFSTTKTNVFVAGVSTGQGAGYYTIRAASLTNMFVTYYPSAAGAATASINVNFAYYVPNASGTTSVYTSPAITNNSTPVQVGPFTPGLYAAPAGSVTVMTVTGAGTGQVRIDPTFVF